jgi:hypothetical protein
MYQRSQRRRRLAASIVAAVVRAPLLGDAHRPDADSFADRDGRTVTSVRAGEYFARPASSAA